MEQIKAALKRLGAVLLCAVLLAGFALPAGAAATPETAAPAKLPSTLRVAFYPLQGFFEYDAQGREAGYGVELLDKISQYTGLGFEYVPAESWEDTKYMLLDGKADLRMPATISSTASTTLSYSAVSIMDTFDAMLTLDSREDLYYQDYDTIRTLKIAVSESFYQVNAVQKYLDTIGVSPDQLILCGEYNDCREKLFSGEADAIISNIMDMETGMKMLTRFNSISNYFSMVLDDPALGVLDEAMAQIKLDEPLFLSNLYEKWFPERTTVPLTLEESEYLSTLDTLTFAYQPNEGYLSHYRDGAYYGIYVEMAKCICDKLGVAYAEASLPECLAGAASADVYAGFFYDYNYAQEFGYSISAPLNDINYDIIKKKEADFDTATCRIAAIEKFRYTKDYLQNKYPEAQFLYYDTYEECLQAVVSGKADMSIINNYIAEYYLDMYQFSGLSAKLSTEYSHLFCFAAADNNTILATILTKAISMISDEEMSQLYLLGQADKPEPDYLAAAVYQRPLQFSLAIAAVMALGVLVVMLIYFGRRGRQKNLELARALSAKSSFLARMSHDMRTPMNGILGLTYLMEEQSDPARIKSYIPPLRDAGEYLLQLINDVLDVNRIESGGLTLNPRVCDEQKLFEGVIALVAPLAKAKNITFNFEAPGIEWQYMRLDEQRVKQIFVNLLTNAIKFTPEGGRVDFVMEMDSRTEDTIRDKFVVRDTGIGMSEEFLPHIFEPFRQEGRVNTDVTKGTGLGMSIVKQLVELMDGTIEVASTENAGTTVTVYLNFPLAPSPAEHPAAEEPKTTLPQGMHVLLCEDHPLNAKIAARLLENRGAQVQLAENGERGVEAFANSAPGHFAAVLMDIRMPVMDGMAAARAIRALGRPDAKTVPIIAVTANAYPEDVQKALDAGMNAHLAKPIDPELLYSTLSGLVAGEKARQPGQKDEETERRQAECQSN